MTPAHNSLQGSEHGHFVASPHGHLNDDERIEHPPDAVLAVIIVIDASFNEGGILYATDDSAPAYWMTEGIPFADSVAHGRITFLADKADWEDVARRYEVRALVIQIPLTTLITALVPDGEGWPGTYARLATGRRPVSSMSLPSSIRSGIAAFANDFDESIEGVIYLTDMMGGGLREPPAFENNRTFMPAILDALRATGNVSPDADVRPWSYYLPPHTGVRRWLLWAEAAAREWYGAPVVQGP